jgi:hypothetical protein
MICLHHSTIPTEVFSPKVHVNAAEDGRILNGGRFAVSMATSRSERIHHSRRRMHLVVGLFVVVAIIIAGGTRFGGGLRLFAIKALRWIYKISR